MLFFGYRLKFGRMENAMNFIQRLEQSKFGRFGIPNLMKYVIVINAVGLLLFYVNPGFFYQYLSLDMYAILHGQVWRIFTFLLNPSMSVGMGNSPLMNIMWFALMSFVYYSIGTGLERMWGTFRFTLFYVMGIVFVIVTSLVFYLLFSSGLPVENAFLGDIMGRTASTTYINETLFLAYAMLFPNAQFLVYFVIPVKAKWMSIVYLGLTAYELYQCILGGLYYNAALIVVALVNLALFWLLARGVPSPRQAVKQKKRQREFQKKVHSAGTGARHRCAICGRTEQDDSRLEFRYCSKCEGNFEYCSDHLFTHEHVRHN